MLIFFLNRFKILYLKYNHKIKENEKKNYLTLFIKCCIVYW